MASCFVKTIGGVTQRNNMFAKDNMSGSGVSDFPILQNSYCACDKNMAAKNNISPTKPPTSCLGSFQGWAGCLGLNTCSISQHPTLHQGQFQLPYVEFHPAVVGDFPQQTQSARKQFVKCQSQRTGKKNNRYFRYGWRSPPKKSDPEGENAGAQTKSENSACKKRKCDKAEHVQKAGEMKLQGELKSEENAKSSDIKSRQCLSSQMSNLSLGESVAIKNALCENIKPVSVSIETEKPKPDWFSIGRRDSETSVSPTKVTVVLDNWDDEICEDVQSENTKLQDDIINLLATDDVKMKSEPNATVSCKKPSQAPENNGPQNVVVERQSDSENTFEDGSLVNSDETLENDTDGGNSMSQNNEPHAVLYQRNNNKKCRPSNKKRSRRKGSKHSKSFKCDQGQKRKSDGVSASPSGASAIAFILGNSHSAADSDSDFSFDSDEDSSESADDDIDFSAHFAEPLCLNVVGQFAEPLCVKVIFPAESKAFQEVSQAVAAANRAWQISLQLSSPKTVTAGNKKVRQDFFVCLFVF
jgi:hypothetical protein